MIKFITGIPGNGKTLYVVSEILPKYKRFQGLKKSFPIFGKCEPFFNEKIEDRKLFTNIIGLDGRFEPNEITIKDVRENCFSNIPDGSVVVIDEAWEFFPTRPNGSVVPNYVEFFATHRHKGIDFILLTQDPTQIDVFIRKMTDSHVQLNRVLGREVSTCFESIGTGIIKSKEDKALKTSLFKYPNCNYTLYKSSVKHTHNKSVLNVLKDFPLKLKLLLLALTALLVNLFFFSDGLSMLDEQGQKTIHHEFSENSNPVETVSNSSLEKTFKTNFKTLYSKELFLSSEICLSKICIPTFVFLSNGEYLKISSEQLTADGSTLKKINSTTYQLNDTLITYKKGSYVSQFEKKSVEESKNNSVF